MRIAIIGSGYVGLVTGTCLAECGHHVTCVDQDAGKIAMLERGESPIYEPGLAELMARNRADGRLSFTRNLVEAMTGAEAVFIAVGTPPRAGDGVADLRFVLAAAEMAALAASGPFVLVTKSTVPVGTGDRIARVIAATGCAHHIDIVSNPEFLREGEAIADFMTPDRIVVGSESEAATQVMRDLYAPLTTSGAPLVVTSRRTAELIKYASNAFLAMKVTFINEIADLCEGTGASVSDVAHAMGLDQRIGPRFLKPGPGFGGSCFPKDILALLKCADDAGTSMRLVESTISINESRKRAMARRIAAALGGDIAGKKIAVLGLTFKPGTDDMRDSPAITIVRALEDQGAIVAAADPKAGEDAQALFPLVEIHTSALAAAKGADAVVLLTDWEEFRAIPPASLALVMRGRLAIDLRNGWEAKAFAAQGFTVHRIGAAPVVAASPQGSGHVRRLGLVAVS